MNVIDFKPAKCSHCYRCVRTCHVKAITIKDQQAQIVADSCIYCGDCLNECPQDAKIYLSDLHKVKKWISDGIPIAVSLAPSYRSLFQFDRPGQVSSALKRLGFTYIRETAEGAALVTNGYRRLLKEKKMENIITTCCPSVNLLIETYYPSLIPYMAPVASPMAAHARMLKKEYGLDVKVVFIGPCIAKKAEAYDSVPDHAVDAVLNFHEIKKWLRNEDIQIGSCDPLPTPGYDPHVNKLYPIAGGIITSVNASDTPDTYGKFAVDGVKNCIDLCEDLLTGKLSNCFIEMSACEGGCIQGPMTGNTKLARFRSRVDLEKNIKVIPAEKELLDMDAPGLPSSQTFHDRSLKETQPSEEQIRAILEKTGKYKKEDELNCGACGYHSCREKAVAVFQGKAELSMCIPYMNEQARSLSNMVLEASPNMMIIVNRELKIEEFSAAAEKHFHLKRKKALETYLFELIDTDDFEWAFKYKQHIHNKKIGFPEYGFIAMMRLIYMHREDKVLAILVDITKEEKAAEQAYIKNLETVELAQQVIDKQMKVAQEIAGLLGETTAETKVTLSNICKKLLDDE